MIKCTLLSYLASGTMAGYMLYDLMQSPEVKVLTGQPVGNKKKGKITRLLYRILWELKLYYLPIQAPRHSWVLIPNETMLTIRASVLRYMQHSGLRIAALMIDPVNATYPTATCAKVLLNRVKFDKVLTFDPSDAEKYGWQYVNTLYSQFPVEQVEKESDLFYIGAVKDRLPACMELLKLSTKYGAEFCLKLLGVNSQQRERLPSDVVLEKPLPYPETLSWLLSTKCIFDMTQQGQSGITLRYYEAVVFNKKLLTNNKNISKLPFYNPAFMRIYETFEDIDWAWVKSEDMPDYRYDGMFSPCNILSLLNG